MSNFLARLVERASRPPTAGLSPRMTPVFPIARAAAEQHDPDREPLRAESFPRPTVAPAAPPAAPRRELVPAPTDTPTPGVTISEAGIVDELREVHVEPPAGEPRETAARVEGQAQAPPRVGVRTHERTLEHSTLVREVEPAPQAMKAPALAAPRIVAQPPPLASLRATTREEAPRIEVRIGRVEVRRPEPFPDPVEPQAPMAAPPAVASFGQLAASRRFVDRRWS